MMNGKITFNRYFVVVGALIVQLCLGSIYAWAIYKTALSEDPYNWKEIYTQLPFAIGLASFAITMIFAGKWQDKIGPRKVATSGGVLLGIAYMLASLVDTFSNDYYATLWLIFTYGILGGAGIGLAYVCPIAALVKWFPDKKGSITGIAVAGFGAGALIFAQVETYFIEIHTEDKIGYSMLVLGITYLILVTLSSQLIRNPPEDYHVAGLIQETKTTPMKSSTTDFTWNEMIKTGKFWMLWFMFMFGAAAGLMTIGNIKSFVQSQNADIDATMAANIVGALSIANAIGRIVWGMVSDKIGRVLSMMCMFVLLSLTMLVFGSINSLFWLTIGAILIGFCFGGNFALFPAVTADFFGSKNIGQNYGMMFTAYGIAGITGALIASEVVEQTGSYTSAFRIMSFLAFIAVILSVIIEYMTDSSFFKREKSVPAST